MSTFFGEKNTLERRWTEVISRIHLEHSDIVFDIGCAEGWISYELAKYNVHKVYGLEIDSERIEQAKKNRPEKFKEKLIFVETDFTLSNLINREQPDVSLYLGVHHKLSVGKQMYALLKLFKCTKRLVVIRTNLTDKIISDILYAAGSYNFSVLFKSSHFEDQGDLMFCHKVVFPI